MREIEAPVETTERGPSGDKTVSRHPAYGQIGISHVSGLTCLYGSDFEHQNYVIIRIGTSELHRDLNRDWHYERGHFIEVAMTEAQYAAFVGSPNRSGVPCTIQQREGIMVPGIPRRDTTHIYSDEVALKMRNMLANLKAQRDEILAATSKLSKVAQQQVVGSLNKAIQEIESNLPFVVESFNEHVETSVEKAKVEVEAYVTNTIMRAGINALSESQRQVADRTNPAALLAAREVKP